MKEVTKKRGSWVLLIQTIFFTSTDNHTQVKKDAEQKKRKVST